MLEKNFGINSESLTNQHLRKLLQLNVRVRKLKIASLILVFLVKYQDGNLQPTFAWVKRFKVMDKKI